MQILQLDDALSYFYKEVGWPMKVQLSTNALEWFRDNESNIHVDKIDEVKAEEIQIAFQLEPNPYRLTTPEGGIVNMFETVETEAGRVFRVTGEYLAAPYECLIAYGKDKVAIAAFKREEIVSLSP